MKLLYPKVTRNNPARLHYNIGRYYNNAANRIKKFFKSPKFSTRGWKSKRGGFIMSGTKSYLRTRAQSMARKLVSSFR